MKLKIYNRELVIEEGLSLNIFKGKDNEIEVDVKLIDDENEYSDIYETIELDIDKRIDFDSVKYKKDPVDKLSYLVKSDKYKYSGFNIVNNKLYVSEIFEGYDNDYINQKIDHECSFKIRNEVKAFVRDCKKLGMSSKTISNNSNIPLRITKDIFTKINKSVYKYITLKKDNEIEVKIILKNLI